jgi:hypothetical protein
MRPASSGIWFYTLLRLLREEQKERSSWWRGDWIAAHRADRAGGFITARSLRRDSPK